MTPNDSLIHTDAWQAMIQAQGQSIRHALQGLRQSTALIELLIAKGVLTKEEVDEQMRSTQELANNLEGLIDRMGPDEDVKS
jgi:hypothetical protein